MTHAPAACAGASDPALPQLAHLTDPAALATLLAAAGWPGVDPTAPAARLRWKPGTNARVGVIVGGSHGPDGPDAVLVSAFARGADKSAGLLDAARRRGYDVVRVPVAGSEVLVVPAGADPALRVPVPARGALSYNPARRWVGRVGAGVRKLYAVAPPRGVDTLLTAPPARLAAHLPRTRVDRHGHRVDAGRVDGRPPAGRDDVVALREALDALHAVPPHLDLPVLDARAVHAAAARAVRAVAGLVPGERNRATRLLGALRAAPWPADRVTLHGDLSPDQVLVTGDRAVLLDLDRAATGPAGWDAAHWALAPLAAGSPAPPPLAAPEAVLVLAAALVRAPEPSRRLHPDRLARTAAVLDVADAAAQELR